MHTWDKCDFWIPRVRRECECRWWNWSTDLPAFKLSYFLRFPWTKSGARNVKTWTRCERPRSDRLKASDVVTRILMDSYLESKGWIWLSKVGGTKKTCFTNTRMGCWLGKRYRWMVFDKLQNCPWPGLEPMTHRNISNFCHRYLLPNQQPFLEYYLWFLSAKSTISRAWLWWHTQPPARYQFSSIYSGARL